MNVFGRCSSASPTVRLDYLPGVFVLLDYLIRRKIRKVLRGGLTLCCQRWRTEYVAQVNEGEAAGSLPAYVIRSLLRKILNNYPPGV